MPTTPRLKQIHQTTMALLLASALLLNEWPSMMLCHIPDIVVLLPMMKWEMGHCLEWNRRRFHLHLLPTFPPTPRWSSVVARIAERQVIIGCRHPKYKEHWPCCWMKQYLCKWMWRMLNDTDLGSLRNARPLSSLQKTQDTTSSRRFHNRWQPSCLHWHIFFFTGHDLWFVLLGQLWSLVSLSFNWNWVKLLDCIHKGEGRDSKRESELILWIKACAWLC